jgi:hypothetical protein
MVNLEFYKKVRGINIIVSLLKSDGYVFFFFFGQIGLN